ncbi:MAG: hypothetical protein FIB02_04645 [Desulfuromonas sp.]|nr:hypothetical protein [Desulfuromonas sp.]
MASPKKQQTPGAVDKSIGMFVAEDYRTAAVFERHGIDFCCGGQAKREGRAATSQETGRIPATKDREVIRVSLLKLGREHVEISDAIHAIRRLSKDYAIPADVCNSFAVTCQKLKEFEADLHKHVRLENNILFPKAALF